MKWVCFLHIYQPPNQSQDVLERVVNESYRPIFRGLKKIPKAKIILNINAVLTEQLHNSGYEDVLNDIKCLAENGRVEFTASAKYHAFIPLVPKSEAVRQIKLNEIANKEYFGSLYNPNGFFSPEMSYSPKVAEVAQEFGFKWVVLDEIAYNGKVDVVKFDRLYKIKGFDVLAFFREKRTSNLIMGAVVRDAQKISDAVSRENGSRYLLTAMDGETFGHHRVGLDKVLLDVLADPKIDTVTISELSKLYKQIEEVTPKDSTWASSEKDIVDGNVFNLWFDKDNEIHKKEWELTDIAIRVVNDSKFALPSLRGESVSERRSNQESWDRARCLLDPALHSCHYWWASANPWWSIEMIEEGVFNLWHCVLNVPDAPLADKERAEKLYFEILLLAHSWQRTGLVKEKSGRSYAWKKIPFSKRANPGEFEALLELLAQEEKNSVVRCEYEQAIRWRDAQTKLKNENDVYDVVHVIDQLRQFVDFKRYEDLVLKYQKEYKFINAGQPER
ncbi:hypothetical protein KJ678_00220 [Patescibacteria group bacterium]|nr:hypothetical protein [Patescibacteria group bacterium]